MYREKLPKLVDPKNKNDAKSPKTPKNSKSPAKKALSPTSIVVAPRSTPTKLNSVVPLS
jgi:hypothetical protein